MKFYLVVFLFSVFTETIAQTAEISGRTISGGDPIPYVYIFLENENIGRTSNEEGKFLIKNIPEGTYVITVSAMGFKTLHKTISFTEGQHIRQNFILEPATDELKEVVIVDNQTGITRRSPYNISSISMEGIEEKGQPGGVMGILKQVPGVYGAELGHGIVKPFIRGLGFTRVVTIYQGNKLENHQWGADHGLGINDLGIKRVDVIKGPASVLYGSGALGGVLLLKDDDYYPLTKKPRGNAGVTYNSVSKGIRTYASLGASNQNNLFFALDMAYENHADYKDGRERIIGNSRFNAQTLRLHSGIQKENFQNKLSLTLNRQNLGIISDEEMDDQQSLATTRNDRNMQFPYQKVTDYLVSYNQSTAHNNLNTSLHVSHHFNRRKEIEESHDMVNLGLDQNHTFYNLRIKFPKENFNHDVGVQGSVLKSENLENALEFLIPDVRIFENGIYYLASLKLPSYFLQGAIRYDHRKVTAFADSEDLIGAGFILPGNPPDRKLTRFFSGFTGSLGATHTINSDQTIKLNFSTGFRAPDLAELFSNGPHPGTSRFETGNDAFDREQSLQTDLAYTVHTRRFNAMISAFGSRIYDYIYFTPTGEVRADDNLEIWAYRQTNATFYGLEFELAYMWLRDNRLTTSISGAIVRANNQENSTPLNFIPPDNYNLKLGYYALGNNSLYFFSQFRIVNDQNRAGINEDPTPGYALLNSGITRNFIFGKNSLKTGLTVQNVLDKAYTDHMSILRAFDIPNPGRNFLFNLQYKF